MSVKAPQIWCPFPDGQGQEGWPTEFVSVEDYERLLGELNYAYLCIISGYRQGVFDFSVLKGRAFAFTNLDMPIGCHRSHPHELMSPECEALTRVARASHGGPPMTLRECVRAEES